MKTEDDTIHVLMCILEVGHTKVGYLLEPARVVVEMQHDRAGEADVAARCATILTGWDYGAAMKRIRAVAQAKEDLRRGFKSLIISALLAAAMMVPFMLRYGVKPFDYVLMVLLVVPVAIAIVGDRWATLRIAQAELDQTCLRLEGKLKGRLAEIT